VDGMGYESQQLVEVEPGSGVAMGFRFRRTLRVLPGVRLNVTHRGLGVRVGPRGAGMSAHSSGRATASVGLPGSGMYWREDYRWRPPATISHAGRSEQVAGPDTAPAPETWRADRLDAALVALASGEPERAEGLLRSLTGSDWRVAGRTVEVTVAPGVTVTTPAGRDAARHALVEALQAQGRLDGALQVAAELPPSDVAAVSVAELLSELGRHEEVLGIFAELPYVASDAARMVDLYVAAALASTGQRGAADERLRQVLAHEGIDLEVRLAALAWRLALAETASRDDVAAACGRAISRIDPDHPALSADAAPVDCDGAGPGLVPLAEVDLLRLRALRAELLEQLIERERLLAEETARLQAFAADYYAGVGRLLAEVAALQACLAEARAANTPADEQLRHDADEARQRAREQADACADTDGPATPPSPASDELKAAYRRAARAMHPDLAADEDDRARRTDAMVRLNAAYDDRDADEVVRLLAAWEQGSPTPARAATDELTQLRREVAKLERRLASLDRERDELTGHPLWELLDEVEDAEADGRDLLAELEADLVRERDELADELLLVTAL
jgi:hypothetical protein